MFKVMKNYKILLTFVFISVFISTVASILQPDVIANIMNAFSATDATGMTDAVQEEIFGYGYQLLGLGLINLVFGIITVFLAARIAQGVGADLRERQFRKIQSLSLKEIDQFKTNNIVVRMTNDVTQIQNFIMLGLSLIIRVPVMFVGSFYLAVVNLPQMWWGIIIFIVLVGGIMGFAMSKMGPLFSGMQKDIDQVNTIVKENMDGVRVVKSFVTEKKEADRFGRSVEALTDKFAKVGGTFSLIIPSFMLVANLLIALTIYLGAGFATDDLSAIGGIFSFTSYLMQIMFALILAGMLSMTLSRAMVSNKRVEEVLAAESSIKYGNENLNEIESIEFENVDFKYADDEEEVLKNVNFKINRGEKIGVVGLTGSGKTTLSNLFVRLYDATSGNIKINGIDIREYSEESLRKNVGIVLQKAVLFSGTIEDNIKQGKKDATYEEMLQAAKDAQAYEFIEKKDGQFQAEVLERGNNFSGGQKQRISIARAFVKQPDLLILDDSTSALDAKSEKLVKNVITGFEDNITILIGQKISSVVDMDRIIVLNDGKIDAIAPHKELVKTSETYRKIFESQRGKEVK